METNILRAANNISALSTFALEDLYSGQNRVNNVGTALEYFVRDMFCSSINVLGLENKQREHSNFLSYLGNQNNPPDFMIKNGDAVEVKKITGLTGGIALNSSYPKSKLHSNDIRILASCRNCDGGTWQEKDIIYSVGTVVDKKIKALWFVYGNCYAAEKEVYERTFNVIQKKIREIDHIEFVNTNEIAGIRKVDPLGITYLRVRGMWGIDTPHKVFSSLTEYSNSSEFSCYILMLVDKYNSFPENDKAMIEGNNAIVIKDVEIRSPNNPAEYLAAKLISIVK